jgi:hypothetical protein
VAKAIEVEESGRYDLMGVASLRDRLVIGLVGFVVQLGFERGWDMLRKFPMLRFWMSGCAATVVAAGVLAASVALPVVAADDKKSADKKGADKPAATDKAAPAEKGASTEKAEGESGKAKPAAKAPKIPEKVYSTGYTGSAQELIDFVNTEIRKGWEANAIAPSEVADDAEWLRRVYLDIVGHIPDSEEVVRFLGDKDKAKRTKVIDELLDTPAFVRNQTVIWTNLLIGRRTPDRISRRGLEKFLRESFAKNKGWDKIVADLLSAQGHFEENGAANFLLAHLNDGAVPATAISARLFLGTQVQCTQCHNHPFNDWKQEQFWEFNSFFKQARGREVEKYDEKTGRMVFDYAVLEKEDAPADNFFEKRNGLMQVAYPTYNGVRVDPNANRREELAKLVVAGERNLVADAMVNRTWGQFFGYGFTKPVDDMGPHNLPSHPAILERLSTEFVKSGYDVKQLIRWVCNTEAYNLTTRFSESNKKIDNPAQGESPLFSHVYVKSMSVEQLYDSLIIATNAHKSGQSSWDDAEKKRQTWMQQFVLAFGTDENDEATTFDGTIPQALMMMNGELVQSALSGQKGSLLGDVLNDTKGKEPERVKRLYHATLGRNPTPRELAAAKKLISGSKTPGEGYQDLYWALLNSNEFIFNH